MHVLLDNYNKYTQQHSVRHPVSTHCHCQQHANFSPQDIPKGSHVKSLPPRKKTSSVSTAVTYIKECACHSCYKFKQAVSELPSVCWFENHPVDMPQIESLIKEKSNIDELCKAILSDLQVSMCMKPTVVMWAWFAHLVSQHKPISKH